MFAAEKITQSESSPKIVHLVAMLPINPDVLDANVTAIVGLPHHPQDAGVINGVVRKRALQTALARASRMEMRRARNQRLAAVSGRPTRVKCV